MNKVLLFFIAPLLIFHHAHAQSFCSQALHGLEGASHREAIFLERFIKPLSSLEEALQSSQNAHEAMLKLTETDYRQYAFKLEALARFYQDEKWAKNFKEYRDLFKRLEDHLGATVDAVHMVKQAKKLNLLPEVIEILEKEALQNQKTLEALLVSDGWIEGRKGSSVFRHLLSELKKLKIPSQEEDAQYVVKRIRHEAKAIIKADLDMHDLQNGLHELRRRLRWILIDLASLRGRLVILEDKKIPAELMPFQNIDDVAKKYLVFETTDYEVKHPVYMKKSAYLALSYFVNWFGKIKDRGEIHQTLLSALLKTKRGNQTQAATDQWLIRQLEREMNWTDFYSEGQEAFNALMKSGLLQNELVSEDESIK